MPRNKVERSCTLCGRAEHQVSRLIPGPYFYVCGDCAAYAPGFNTEMVSESTPRFERTSNDQELLERFLDANSGFGFDS